MSDQQDARRDAKLREVADEARDAAHEAEGFRAENERAAAGDQATDYAFRLPPDVAEADRVRAGSDVELADRQLSVADTQRRAAETLRRSAGMLQGTGRELERAGEAVRGNREDLRDIQRNEAELRAQMAEARDRLDAAEGPRVGGPGDTTAATGMWGTRTMPTGRRAAGTRAKADDPAQTDVPPAGTRRAIRGRPSDGIDRTISGRGQMAENDQHASEDSSEAQRHMRNVQENTEALAEQARRVQASAPEGTDHPIQGHHVPGMGGEDNTQAARNQQNVQENLDALEAQARRVDASAPDDVDRAGGRNT